MRFAKESRKEGHVWHEFRALVPDEWQLAYQLSKIVKDDTGFLSEKDALSLVQKAGGVAQYIREQVESMARTSKTIWYAHFFEELKKKSTETPSEGLSLPSAEMSGDVTPPN